jgi:hypothetical protein
MRKHIGWYIKGFRNAAAFRDQAMRAAEAGALRESILRFFDQPQERAEAPDGASAAGPSSMEAQPAP